MERENNKKTEGRTRSFKSSLLLKNHRLFSRFNEPQHPLPKVLLTNEMRRNDDPSKIKCPYPKKGILLTIAGGRQFIPSIIYKPQKLLKSFSTDYLRYPKTK